MTHMLYRNRNTPPVIIPAFKGVIHLSSDEFHAKKFLVLIGGLFTIASTALIVKLIRKLIGHRPKHISLYRFFAAVAFLVCLMLQLPLGKLVHGLMQTDPDLTRVTLVHQLNSLMKSVTFVTLCATFFAMSDTEFTKHVNAAIKQHDAKMHKESKKK